MKRAGHVAFTASGGGTRADQTVTEQRIRYLLVFVKREHRWQIVAEQRTSARGPV